VAESAALGVTGPADKWATYAPVGVLAALLVSLRIGSFGLWGDEGFSVSTSLRPVGDLAQLSIEQETNGVLYAFFLKAWAAFGISETWLRTPSALAFVATALLVAGLGRRLHSSLAGTVAGLLVCIHGSLLMYGQNVRYYAPVTALSAGFLLAVLRVDDTPRPQRSRLVVVGVLAIILPLVHLVSGTLIGGALVWSSRKERRPQRVWILTLLPGVIVTLVVAFLVSSRNEGQTINQPLGPAAVADVLYSLSGSGGLFGLLGYLLLAGGALVALLRRQRVAGPSTWARPFGLTHSPLDRPSDIVNRQAVANQAFAWVFVIVSLGAIVLGSLVTTLMVGRYVLFLVPALAVGVGVGLVDLLQSETFATKSSPRVLGAVTLPQASPAPWGIGQLVRVGGMLAAVAVGATGAASGAARWTLGPDRVDWRPVAETLLAEAEPTDAVLFANDSMRLFVEYELRKHPEQLAGAPRPVFPAQPWGEYRTGDQRYVTFNRTEFDCGAPPSTAANGDSTVRGYRNAVQVRRAVEISPSVIK
jgi:hypothetical protein